MKEVEILNSIALKKRFCKDCNLPIAVYDNPYFMERLKAIDPFHDSVQKFVIFCNSLADFENEQDYFEYYNSVKQATIDYIHGNPHFQDFNSSSGFAFEKAYTKRNLYVEENDGKYFISLDMKKANFSALQHYCREIFDGKDTWELFMMKFTTNEHIINSKYIRQVIMGACNPKKQITYECKLMNNLLKELTSGVEGIEVYSLVSDEIILCADSHSFDLIHNIEGAVKLSSIGKNIRISYFMLRKLVGMDGWEKIPVYTSALPEFKGLNAEIYHQVVKYAIDQEITENDLVFYHNGQLAKFLKAVNNPFEN